VASSRPTNTAAPTAAARADPTPCARQPPLINHAVLDAIPDLAGQTDTIAMVGLSAQLRFEEPQDERFLV